MSAFVDNSADFNPVVEDSIICHTLSSVAASNFVEAGASEYILETIKYRYKLVFIDYVPPPKDFRPNNKSALS